MNEWEDAQNWNGRCFQYWKALEELWPGKLVVKEELDEPEPTEEDIFLHAIERDKTRRKTRKRYIKAIEKDPQLKAWLLQQAKEELDSV
jgi:hypothetical protein